MGEEKKALKFRGTLALAIIALLLGAFYFFYLLPKSKADALKEELSKQFFRIDREAVDLIRLRNVNGSFEIVREGRQWRITVPRDLKADKEAVKRILDVVSQGRVVKIVSSDMGRLSEFGLSSPRVLLLVGYGGKIDELFLADPNPANTDIYAYGRGKSAIFMVGKEVGKVLSAGLHELRKKEIFEFDPGLVEGIKIKRKDGVLEFGKTAGEWMILEPVKGKGSKRSIEDFLNMIANQKAEEFFDDAYPDRRKYGDSMKIELYGPGGKPVSSLDVYYWGTGAREGVVTYQPGKDYYARTQRDFWNFLRKDFYEFKYRNLFSFEEDEVARIEVKAEEVSFSLSKDGSRWLIDGKPAEQSAVKNLLWHLKAWEAVKLERTADVDAEKKSPKISIVLFERNGKKAGGLSIFEKKKFAGYSADGLKEINNFYAVSTNLETPCYVNSLDIEKVTGKKAFEAREGK